jgi:hypothetical protein
MMVNRWARPICHLVSLDQFILSPAVSEAALQKQVDCADKLQAIRFVGSFSNTDSVDRAKAARRNMIARRRVDTGP